MLILALNTIVCFTASIPYPGLLLYMLSQQVAMDYLLSSPDHSLDPWMLLPYDASPPLALDSPQTASGLENQLNTLPNQENFENQRLY